MATFTAPLRPTTAAANIDEFAAMQPDPQFQAREERGLTDYGANKASLKFIQAESGLPFVDLPAKLKQLMEHCWKGAKAQAGTRGPLQIGASAARTNHIPGQMGALQATRLPANIIEARRMQERNAQYAKQVYPFSTPGPAAPEHLKAVIPEDWGTTNQLERVNAYTFRGDRRPLQAVQAAGGFYPPITRTDQQYVEDTIYPAFRDYMQRRYGMEVTKGEFYAAYQNKIATGYERVVMNGFFAWRSMVENEAYHVGRMLASETLKGFISTTKSLTVAKGFAGDGGWVYVTLVQGGFLVPDKGKHVWTTVFGEQEIALPAPIPWSNVFGFRKVARAATGLKFTGPVYLRRSLQSRNAKAYQECYELLSGKVQG